MEYSSLVLAYIGDAVYEIYVRKFLLTKNIVKVDALQKEAINYVSAKNQALFLDKLIQKDFFTRDEIDIMKRARNTKCNSKPRNTDILTYKHATALEAIVGYFYLKQDNEKLENLMKEILG